MAVRLNEDKEIVKTVKEGFGNADLFAQSIDAAVNQASFGDGLNDCGEQGFPDLFPFFFRIRFSCHMRSHPCYKIKNKMQKW